jgi:hypothetical protein
VKYIGSPFPLLTLFPEDSRSEWFTGGVIDTENEETVAGPKGTTKGWELETQICNEIPENVRNIDLLYFDDISRTEIRLHPEHIPIYLREKIVKSFCTAFWMRLKIRARALWLILHFLTLSNTMDR